MKIGKLALEVGAPDAERLLASTGCTPERMQKLLSGPCAADTIACALNACVAEPANKAELARAIAAEGTHRVRKRVAVLFRSVAPLGAAAEPKRKGRRRGKTAN